MIYYIQKETKEDFIVAIYIVTSFYFNSGIFGSYSSIKRARDAFEKFLATDDNIIVFEDVDDYGYQFTTKSGEIFGADIYYDILDAEFEEDE